MAGETITRIIQRAYGRRYNLDSQELAIRSRYHLTSGDYLYRWYTSVLAFFRNKWLLITLAASAVLLSVMTIYYYNLLVVAEQQVLTADSKVSALMQRRNDISINLSKAVFNYSKHEQNVMTGIVALRSLIPMDEKKDQVLQKIQENFGTSDSPIGAAQVEAAQVEAGQVEAGQAEAGQAEVLAQKTMEQALAANPLSSLKKILAVAEQYPDLKLSTTFLSLMTALIDVEKDLAAERLLFNDAVNIYTTSIAMFPSNIYADLFKFVGKPYFEPTEEATRLKPIAY